MGKNPLRVYKDNVLGDNYFCVDIETTSLDPTEEGAEILEIYIKIMKSDKKVKEYFLQYWGDNWEKTKHIHQIPKEEIDFKPKFSESIEDKELIKALFMRCCDPNDDMIFMAQYAPFEFKWFLNNLDLSDEEKEKIKFIRTCDTRYIAKFLYPDEPHNLIKLCEKFKIGFPEGQHDFHRADQDVNAMWDLFIELRKNIPESEIVNYDIDYYFYNFDQTHDNNNNKNNNEEIDRTEES